MELIVGGFALFALLAVFGLAAALISFVVWMVLLPLQLIAIAFKFLGFLIALPFVALAGIIAVAAVGFSAMFLFLPFMPLILLGLGLIWLIRRSERTHARVSGQPTAQPTA